MYKPVLNLHIPLKRFQLVENEPPPPPTDMGPIFESVTQSKKFIKSTNLSKIGQNCKHNQETEENDYVVILFVRMKRKKTITWLIYFVHAGKIMMMRNSTLLELTK